MSGSLDLLPLELCELITSRLQPGALRSLCAASKHFGQQPTSHLPTRLSIALPTLNCFHRRTGRFSRVTAVIVTGAVEPDAAPRCSHLLHLVLFVSRFMPSMTLLTKLTLMDLFLSTVVAAAACLPSGCPHLAWLELHDIAADRLPNTPAFTDLWPALASIASLRRLNVRSLQLAPRAALSGVGAVTQLLSLSTRDSALHLSDILHLVSLTKLTVGPLLGLPLDDADLPDVPGIFRLQRLRLRCSGRDKPPTHQELRFLQAAATACCSLTSLRFDVRCAPQVCLAAAAFTQLASLRVEMLKLSCTQLAAMPALGYLDCRRITLPPAGSNLTLPQLRVIDCGQFQLPKHAVSRVLLSPQSVAQTFPQLTALGWYVDAGEGQCAQLWPEAGGQLRHCTSLRLPMEFPLHLARCAVAVTQLWIGSMDVLSDRCLPALLAVGPRLRRVELCKPSLDDSTLSALVTGWSTVEDVTLRGVDQALLGVTDAGLAALARLPLLRRVRLLRLAAITPVGVAALAAKWSVEVIEMRGCAQVGAADVAHMRAAHGRPQLDMVHSLVVDSTPSVKDWLCPPV